MKLILLITLSIFWINFAFALPQTIWELDQEYILMFEELDQDYKWYENDEELKQEYLDKKRDLENEYKEDIEHLNRIEKEKKDIELKAQQIKDKKVSTIIVQENWLNSRLFTLRKSYKAKYTRALDKILANLSDDKIKIVIKRIEILIDKYSDIRMSQYKKDKILAQLLALRDIFYTELNK